jgi:hypothetical protein
VTLFRDPLLARLAAEWERAEDLERQVQQARERAASAYCERFRELWEERFGCE